MVEDRKEFGKGGSLPHQPHLPRPRYCFRPVADAELGEDRADVKLNGAFGDHELSRDLLVEPAPGNKREDFMLAWSQRFN